MTPEERAIRRAVIKAHHPDRGGDPHRFAELLDALERSVARRQTRIPGGTTGVPTGPAGRRRVRRRLLVRRARARLPRGVPGAKRYATY